MNWKYGKDSKTNAFHHSPLVFLPPLICVIWAFLFYQPVSKYDFPLAFVVLLLGLIGLMMGHILDEMVWYGLRKLKGADAK